MATANYWQCSCGARIAMTVYRCSCGLERHHSVRTFNEHREEADLHERIIEHCKAMGWLYFRGRMDKMTTRPKGEPDFLILMHGGRLLMVECKSKDGKLTREQAGVQMHAAKLGHTVHIVRSIGEFEQLVTDQIALI